MGRRFAFLFLIASSLVLILAPIFPFDDPLRTSELVLSAPNSRHALGTDALGRDVLSRLVFGGRQTWLVAIGATSFALLPGILAGAILGLLPGRWNSFGLSMLSVFLSVPGLVTALIVLTLTGQGGLQVAVAVGIAQIAYVAQVVRGAVRVVMNEGYVEASYTLGARWPGIVFRHVLSGIRPTLISYSGVVFSYCLLNSAALSFLGFGVELGQPEWGLMMAEGRAHVTIAPWISFYPGLLITLTVLSVNGLVNSTTVR